MLASISIGSLAQMPAKPCQSPLLFAWRPPHGSSSTDSKQRIQRGRSRKESCLDQVLKRDVLVVLMDEKRDGKLVLLELGALDCCRGSGGKRSIQGNIPRKGPHLLSDALLQAACMLCAAPTAAQGFCWSRICDPSLVLQRRMGTWPATRCVSLKYLLLPLLVRRQSLVSLV